MRRKGLFDTLETAWNNGNELLRASHLFKYIMPRLLNYKLKSLLHTNIMELRDELL